MTLRSACVLVVMLSAHGGGASYAQSSLGRGVPTASLGEMLSRADAKLQTGEFDAGAQGILDAATVLTAEAYHISIDKPDRVVSYRGSEGDTILARWVITDPHLRGKLYLEDTSCWSRYFLELPEAAWRSRADVQAWIWSIWPDPTLNTNAAGIPATLAMSSSGDNGAVFYAHLAHPPVSTPGVYERILRGTTAKKGWIVEVDVAKGVYGKAYPVPPFIEERFPPLSALSKNWTTDRLIEELTRWFEFGPFGHSHPERDEVLIRELCSRDIGAPESIAVIKKAMLRSPSWARELVVRLKSALSDAHKPEVLLLTIDALADELISLGPAAESPFLETLRDAPCSGKLERRAFDVLRAGIFLYPALSYIERCSSDAVTLSFLENLRLPGNPTSLAESTRLRAIRSIRGRLKIAVQ